MYYGRWPWYWDLWARSVANNPNIDFLIFTDLDIPNIYSENISFANLSLEEAELRFSNVLNFKVLIRSPHKLCDYKSLFGLAFCDYLMNYKYWGYCDVDLIFGDLSPFVELTDTGYYDIISPWDFTVGHCTIIKNVERCNSISLKTNCLESRLREPGVTFIDEGGFSETALKIGGFKFKVCEDVLTEFEKDQCFLGATIGPACMISRINTDFIVRFKQNKIYISFGKETQEHEVLYLHFMAAKNKKYWVNYKGGGFDGWVFSRIGWIEKPALDPRFIKGYLIKSFFFNSPDLIYAKIRGLVPSKAVMFLKKMKLKITKKR